MSFESFRPLVETVAARYGYPAALLAAQADAESDWNPRAFSRVGASGLMQFMPDTWSEWGKGAPVDPEASLDAGVRYMQWLLGQFKGAADPPALAFAAYNWGIGHVKKAITKSGRTDWDGIKSFMHSETRAYVERILARASKYRTIFQGPVAGPSVTPGGSPLRFDEGGFINLRTLGLMALAGLLGLVLLRKILG